MKERSFLSRVRKILPDLHPAELRLGELVCDFPGELASYSASELAVADRNCNSAKTKAYCKAKNQTRSCEHSSSHKSPPSSKAELRILARWLSRYAYLR